MVIKFIIFRTGPIDITFLKKIEMTSLFPSLLNDIQCNTVSKHVKIVRTHSVFGHIIFWFRIWIRIWAMSHNDLKVVKMPFKMSFHESLYIFISQSLHLTKNTTYSKCIVKGWLNTSIFLFSFSYLFWNFFLSEMLINIWFIALHLDYLKKKSKRKGLIKFIIRIWFNGPI